MGNSYADTVASLGCLVCRDLGHGPSPAEIHHIRSGQGRKRAGDGLILPLCYPHHRGGGPGVAFHAGARQWQALYGNEWDLLSRVILEANAKPSEKGC